jgi:hypothetical protein
VRLKTNTQNQATQTPPTTYSTTAPAPVVTKSTATVTTVQKSTPMARGHRKRCTLAWAALWLIGLVPLIALGLAIKPRIETQLRQVETRRHHERVASRKEPLAILPIPPGNYIFGMAIGPKNQLAVAYRGLFRETSLQEGIQIFDLKTALPMRRATALRGLSSGIAFSPDGKSLSLPTVIPKTPYAERHTIEFRESATGQLRKRVELVDPLTNWHNSGVLSLDSLYYIRPVNYGSLQLLDTSSGKLVKTLKPLDKLPETAHISTLSMAISENSDWVAARIDKEPVHDPRRLGAELTLWHKSAEKPRWRVPVCASGGSVLPLTVGKKGEVLAVLDFPESSDPGTHSIGCLEPQSGHLRWSFPTPGGDVVRSLAISPDGSSVAIFVYDYIELRRMEDGVAFAQWKRPKDPSQGSCELKFTPDGSHLLDRRGDSIAIWSLEGLK